MLKDLFTEITDKDFIDEIFKQVQVIDLVQCNNCGSVKINAKELAKALAKSLHNVNIESEFYDNCRWLLAEIFEGVPEECLADTERWLKWDEYRKLDSLKGYETDSYLRPKEVLLITNPQCQCFHKEKCAEGWTMEK